MQKTLKMTENPGPWVLIEKNSLRTIQWIPTWEGLDGLQKSLWPCSLENSHSIGRFKHQSNFDFTYVSNCHSYTQYQLTKNVINKQHLFQLIAHHHPHHPINHHKHHHQKKQQPHNLFTPKKLINIQVSDLEKVQNTKSIQKKSIQINLNWMFVAEKQLKSHMNSNSQFERNRALHTNQALYW